VIAYYPSGTSGAYDTWTGVPIGQPATPSAVRTGVADAAYFGIEVQNNLLASVNASVASPFYRSTWTCVSGLATGDPVRISASGTVVLAAASGSGTSDVVGFCRDKSGDTSCWLAHFWRKTGITGTVGAAAYLQNAGTVSDAAGTFSKVLGVYDTTTTALLFADSVSSLNVRNFLNSGSPTAITGVTADSGTSQYAARLDHVHSHTFSGAPYAVGTGSGGASGSGTLPARYDHSHALRTGWDDIMIPIFGQRWTGSSDPTPEVIGAGGTVIRATRFDINNEVFFIAEIPHSYKEGTDLYPHVHWFGVAASGTEPLRFVMDIQWRSGSDIITISGTGEVSYSGSGSCGTGYAQRYMSLATITGTSGKMGQQIMGRFRRITNGATDYASAVYVQTVGIHFQMDSFGSLNETSKT
jgi:hypothetical protein